MLQLTKRTEYGLIALSLLAERQGEFVSVREICERFPVPRRLVAEVLKELCREGIVESQRGATGGYSLARPAASTSVGDVVSALEGAPSMASCHGGDPLSAPVCEVEHVCPIRDPIQRLRFDLWRLLERTNLLDLVRRPDSLPPRPESLEAHPS
jgi:Rrf2 family protein